MLELNTELAGKAEMSLMKKMLQLNLMVKLWVTQYILLHGIQAILLNFVSQTGPIHLMKAGFVIGIMEMLLYIMMQMMLLY